MTELQQLLQQLSDSRIEFRYEPLVLESQSIVHTKGMAQWWRFDKAGKLINCLEE
jgi:hypothetical protein